jgi:hypothetical protein
VLARELEGVVGAMPGQGRMLMGIVNGFMTGSWVGLFSGVVRLRSLRKACPEVSRGCC